MIRILIQIQDTYPNTGTNLEDESKHEIDVNQPETAENDSKIFDNQPLLIVDETYHEYNLDDYILSRD